MPGFDRTGPRGMGPRTGGGRGTCPPGTGQAYEYGPDVVRGVGRGGIPWGGGRGWGWGGGRGGGPRGGGRGWAGPPVYGPPPYGADVPYSPPDAGQQMEALRNQASFLEQELQRIRKRLDELGGKEAEAE